MAATQNWNNFSAFAGAARLDASYMANITDTFDENDVIRFYRWIRALNANVGPATGIPNAYVTSVRTLLAAFFPNTADDSWLPAVRIKSQNNQGLAVVVSLVEFGNAAPNQHMEIVDGPTALGYIFSVAIPPANPTLLNYYLPLAALYTRFLYLAFVYDKLAGTQELVDAVGDLPQMSCVMYAGANATIRYIYGSTPAFIPTADPNRGAERANALTTLDTYRLNQVLVPALAQEVPGAQIPRYSPRHIEALADQLWSKIIRTKDLNPKVGSFKAPAIVVQQKVISIYKTLPLYQQLDLVALPWSKVRAHDTWGEALMSNLRIVVQDRLNVNYNRDSLSPATVYAWRGIIRTYLAPHIYRSTDGTFTNVITDPSTQTVVDEMVNELMNDVWPNLEPKVLNELDIVFNAQVNKPQHTPFGRCAETYCIVGMLRRYFPLETIDNVRGISLAVSKVGGSNAFRDGFNTIQLGQEAGRGVYRLPCINCQRLLPLYHVNIDQYNTDIYTIPDRNNTDPF